MSLEACLPLSLRTASTVITKVAAGLSGAGVYRVDAGDRAFVLKRSDEREPVTVWRRKVRIQQSASDAGVAPRIVHTDESRRAVLSEYVVDRSFRMLYFNPATRDTAIDLLGSTLRQVHALPLPPGVAASDARQFLTSVWSGLAGFPVPDFVDDAIRTVLSEKPPARDRELVLSHNDVNPTNLVFDGERLLLFDWETAGPNDPLYDLAAVSVFLRMDEGTCRRLVSAHDGATVDELPARFLYNRRLAAVMCGAMFIHLARQGGHPGAFGADEALSLAGFYQRLRAGELNVASSDGQWAFGLALVKEAGLG